jgi:hypothetical protein
LGLGVAAMAQMRTTQEMPMQMPAQPQRYDLTQGMMPPQQNPSGLSSLLDQSSEVYYKPPKQEVNFK